MRNLILTIGLTCFGFYGYTQEKAVPSANKAETTQANVKVITDKSALKIASPAPNAVEKKRSAAPAKKVKRSAEVIEKKKTAPLLNEPQ